MASALTSPGRLVSLRGREWIVLPSDETELLLLKPLGGSEEEITGIYLPLGFKDDEPREAEFPAPKKEDLGAFSSARLLLESARLAFRNGAGPFRCLAKLSFRPRAYQIVPLIMALRHEPVRLLVADDVGVGKTIEALLIVRELLERRVIRRFAVLCLPHLCDQWQEEIHAKIGIEAVVIRSNTQAKLDREIHGDASVFQHFPYQVLSIDYIKSEARRDVFVSQCPELVIVDEAHTCARPSGASPGQQQRHDLLRRIAEKDEQHLVMLTATPHSGKPDEFQSLLGLLHRDFGNLDLPSAGQEQRKRLAKHFVQRRRGDVLKWMGEETPFAKREAGEISYELGPAYGAFFDQVLDFARKLVATPSGSEREQRVHYWTALGLLRGIMSSPAAGVEMLRNRLESCPAEVENGEVESNPVHDSSDGFLLDVTPSQTVGQVSWSDPEKRHLASFARQLESLSGPKHDGKLEAAAKTISEWLRDGFQPVIFCRYLATARYVGEQLRFLLAAKFKDLRIEVVTSEDPDDVRRQRVADLGKAQRRLLVATDCLSEGINLQEFFTAVLHYDLPWNPNRLEQREGRVDRFGQTADQVKAYLLFGRDNPVDGLVLGVILEKVRQIRRDRGITVPFPEDSSTVLDTVAKALLLNPDRRVRAHSDKNQLKLELDLEDFSEAREAELRITHKIEAAAKREGETRSIFAQHFIKAEELEVDLREADAAIGDVAAVERFVTGALTELLGVQIDRTKTDWRLHTGNLPAPLRAHLPEETVLDVSFRSPTPKRHLYLGRNHPFVEALCQFAMAKSLAQAEMGAAARAAVMRTRAVKTKTTLLLFRCRNVIGEKNGPARIVAEEMLVWGYRGSPNDRKFLTSEEAMRLLDQAKPSGDLTPQSRENFFDNELKLIGQLREQFDAVAEERNKHLVESHERFSKFFRAGRYEVVYPVLPMDIMGLYILLPEAGQ
ncbi:MAG: helicase [Verrucomicrobia bacterium SCN 57-15]|jgi:superfamily II DNA or RNA helicase|nr:MAG: helicase [Verrucomicrobia bacterium SCN 57-15]